LDAKAGLDAIPKKCPEIGMAKYAMPVPESLSAIDQKIVRKKRFHVADDPSKPQKVLHSSYTG
jgi:hypothetical protein